MVQVKVPSSVAAMDTVPSEVALNAPSVFSLPSFPKVTEAQLLSDLTHDLRHPASTAIQCAWLLQDQSYGQMSEVQSKIVEDIVRSSREALAQVDALLSWLQAEAGCLALSPTAINLDYFLPELVDALQQKFGVEITLKLRLCDSGIVGDRYRLNYILTTLIERALSVSEPGAARVVVFDCPDGRPGSWVVDIHLPPAKPNAAMFSGTGLLLTNALLKKLSGHIEYDSHEQSSCLRLTLPCDCRMP